MELSEAVEIKVTASREQVTFAFAERKAYEVEKRASEAK